MQEGTVRVRCVGDPSIDTLSPEHHEDFLRTLLRDIHYMYLEEKQNMERTVKTNEREAGDVASIS